jgi:hypothetical protein
VPVLVVVEVPGGSSALDAVLTDAWGTASSPPAGNLLRMAGPMDGGWRVISLWESRGQFETFLEERLHLSLGDRAPGEPVISFWDIETVHRFE